MVVSNIFYFHPYLGKIPILTNIFQVGWNHQLVLFWECFSEYRFASIPLGAAATNRGWSHGGHFGAWMSQVLLGLVHPLILTFDPNFQRDIQDSADRTSKTLLSCHHLWLPLRSAGTWVGWPGDGWSWLARVRQLKKVLVKKNLWLKIGCCFFPLCTSLVDA